MLRRRRLLAGAIAVLAFALPASSADAAPPGWYQVPYSDDIFFEHDHGPLISSIRTLERTRVEWEAAGSPATAVAPTMYVKHPWSPTIYALIEMEIDREDSLFTLVRALSPAQWQHAGFPAPRVVADVLGSRYHRWVYSDEVFVEAPDGDIHKLSMDEWSAAGFPQPAVRTRGGYAKVSWSPGIAYMYSMATGNGVHLTFDEWADAGYPTPREVTRFPNDVFCFDNETNEFRYYGPTFRGLVTQDQMNAAGVSEPASCYFEE